MKIVYSLPNCPGCVQLKAKLKLEGTEFVERIIGVDIDKHAFTERYPNVKSVPFVVEE